MLERFRAAWTKVIAPIAAFFVRHNVSPDVITVVGTLGVVVGAAVCYPQGWLWQGTVIIVLFVFADMVDGQMARSTGRASTWGAFLDSSLDRLGDGAVFGGIALYFIHGAVLDGRQVAFGLETIWTAVTLWALVMGQVTSYVKARAEALGFDAGGGLAARADRLLIILFGALVGGLGVPYVLELAVTALAVMSTLTVFQRIAKVYRQAQHQAPPAEQGPSGAGA
ncbi:phosphatidylinositol phosphate synthase [Microlunatus soli]|uniref:Phosphatidylinositol phosphate synthase n=1 Tax=Microlunatus soli TaxID=630515 RepID=A0A1H2AN27_9ACTN|nr:CDP-alcohol phosphatidyltransferase family protein [Microlunatus soli]SDT47254.1 CDP-diacylglycerol--glycerol-3-phosphate 3-phosphatidyltransferase [Microlunatus soli]